MLSYSGLSNYGKASLPSVKGWNGSLNIMRDPPKSIYTKRIERVGDTNAVMNALAHSEDRFIENINFYARGVNPMVSVTYGEGQTIAQTSARGQAYLPYRIMKDGAFRPPIKRQEDLLPLSRLPRKWTNVECKPTNIADHTKRLISIGTAETTPQVKNQIRTIECQTRKIISKAPAITAPIVNTQTRDTTLRVSAQTGIYDPKKEENIVRPSFSRMKEIVNAFSVTSEYNPSYAPITERPSILLGEILNPSGYTNPSGIDNTQVIPEVTRNLNKTLNPEGHTNPSGIDKTQTIPEVTRNLKNNLPMASAHTNACLNAYTNNSDAAKSFHRLHQKPSLGEYTGRPAIPPIAGKRTLPVLRR